MPLDDLRRREINLLTENVVGAAIEVHRELGPGLLESAYHQCLCRELTLRGLSWKSEVPLPVEYKGIRLDCGYAMDIVVESLVLLALKAVASLLPVHEAQIITYLKLSGIKVGFLMTFYTPVLKDGIKRFAYDF